MDARTTRSEARTDEPLRLLVVTLLGTTLLVTAAILSAILSI
jgi:hypothetical protein